MMDKMKKWAKKPSTYIIMFLAIGLGFSAVTLSRYVLQDTSEKITVGLNEFYFDSDYLKENETPVYTISDLGDNGELIIEIRNYIDDLRYSIDTITYDVTTSTNIPASNINIGSFDASGNLKTSLLKVKIPSDGYVDGKYSFKLSVTSTSPYRSTLSAIFEVYDKLQENDALVTLDDNVNSFTVTMKVETEGLFGEVEFSKPSSLLPDRTDYRIYDITDSTFKVNLDKNSVYYFRFFKEDVSSLYKIDTNNKFSIVN